MTYESYRLRDAATGHDLDAGRGPDQRRLPRPESDAPDIFPSQNTPKVYVFSTTSVWLPAQMEGFIVNQLELLFSVRRWHPGHRYRGISSRSLCASSFFLGTDMGQAMGQVAAMFDRAMSWMPKGTLPPMIMRMDAGSVPVGYLSWRATRPRWG